MARIELKDINLSLQNTRDVFLNLFPFLSGRNKQGQNGHGSADRFIIHDLNLIIPDGGTTVILGPSGCGKTTLLKVIAGLLPPLSGAVLYDGVDVTRLEPGARKIGMIFQNYAIYPEFTTKQNVLSYFIFKRKTPELSLEVQEKFERTSRILGIDMEVLYGKNPRRMSQGEKQRVALGRCITRDPSLFLMDEPFSNLDRKLRERYRTELKGLLTDFNVTTVFVTHDHQEALFLADTIAIMHNGAIEQVGTIEEIYNNPCSMFVADFFNPATESHAVNFIKGEIIDEKYRGYIIGVRPDCINIETEKKNGSYAAVLVSQRHVPIKNISLLTVEIDGTRVFIEAPINTGLSEETELYITLEKFHVFDEATGRKKASINY